jgi:hypothetical protein
VGVVNLNIADFNFLFRKPAMILQQQLAIIPVLILLATTTLISVSRLWRYTILALVAQYLAVAWLVAMVWPIGLAVVKLVVGWMSSAILGAAQTDRREDGENGRIFVKGFLFRLFAIGVVWLVVFSVAPSVSGWFAAPLQVLWGSSLLIGAGILQMGISGEPFRVFVGLLTALAGFEVLYATVESSVLVAGLLAMANLGLALAGSYLMVVNTLEEL